MVIGKAAPCALGFLLASLGPSLRAADVTVFAASSLSEALEDVATAYERETGNHVVFNLAGSNDLARQIQAGAPADIFFSADLAQMDAVERAGLVHHAARVEALSNCLAVVVPQGATTSISSASDLLKVRRLALADPAAVPAGVYAKEWLESKGVWGQLAERVVPTLNVRAALAAVETEAVDAGIVYRTDAAISKRVRVAFEVPRAEGPKIVYALAPLAASTKPATRALVRFRVSAPAAETYERYGFIVLFPR
jgi:molybdate transport system substrate-binding protein